MNPSNKILNLIYEDEDFLRFKEVNPNEPQQ